MPERKTVTDNFSVRLGPYTRRYHLEEGDVYQIRISQDGQDMWLVANMIISDEAKVDGVTYRQQINGLWQVGEPYYRDLEDTAEYSPYTEEEIVSSAVA